MACWRRRRIEPPPLEEAPSRRLVDQRVRNGVISYFELAASFDEQLEYQRNVPIARVSEEMIESWEDVATDDLPTLENLGDAYSDAEVAAMADFYPAWLAAIEAMRRVDWPRDVADAQRLPEWHEMREVAARAVSTFAIRGRMSDDHEEPN
jgi:hypothetical protein